MPSTYTPLRYPGGKAKFAPFLSAVFRANRLIDGEYAEPYAGGAGAAMYLLFRGYATRVHLNDIDQGVTSFWRAVLNEPERFARAVEKVPLSLREWDRQRATYRAGGRGFDLGFAFFYLNRTNRSGIMNAGVIGGRDQKGRWKIDARFNRATLAERIRAIGSMRRFIAISHADALDFLGNVVPPKTRRRLLVYLDPPYFDKGQQLYPNFYERGDHATIARRVKRLRTKWLLTYDDCPEIRALYRGCNLVRSELSYSAREVRRGREIVVASEGLKIPAFTPDHKPEGKPGFEIKSRVSAT